ncbi:hypothetical protein ABT389_08135 [Streptomyces bacillaris]|uniref:hypothetical protein n=1 Tax=Streptomyces bacillaris TaxID=68179 RepID=UPI00335D92C1
MTSTDAPDDLCQHLADEAIAQARPGETVRAHVHRVCSRTYELFGDGPIRSSRTDGPPQTLLTVEHDGREAYASCPGTDRLAVASALDALRAELRHCPVTYTASAPPLYERRIAGSAHGPDPLSARLAAFREHLCGSLAEGLLRGQSLASAQVGERFTYASFSASGTERLMSRQHGYEVRAVATDEATGAAVAATRYSTAGEPVNQTDLAQELSLMLAAASAPGSPVCADGTALLMPTATAQLLRQLVAAMMANPLTKPVDWATEIVDDAMDRRGYASRPFDHEGTPTGVFPLVGRNGRQAPIRSHNAVIGPPLATQEFLTGHANWLVWQTCPQPAPSNVRFHSTYEQGDFHPSSHQQTIVDIRPLGVQHLSSGENLAFRAARVSVDDRGAVKPLPPVVLSGTPRDFLLAVTSVSDVVSYMPGDVSAAGSAVVMDFSRLA